MREISEFSIPCEVLEESGSHQAKTKIYITIGLWTFFELLCIEYKIMECLFSVC